MEEKKSVRFKDVTHSIEWGGHRAFRVISEDTDEAIGIIQFMSGGNLPIHGVFLYVGSYRFTLIRGNILYNISGKELKEIGEFMQGLFQEDLKIWKEKHPEQKK